MRCSVHPKPTHRRRQHVAVHPRARENAAVFVVGVAPQVPLILERIIPEQLKCIVTTAGLLVGLLVVAFTGVIAVLHRQGAVEVVVDAGLAAPTPKTNILVWCVVSQLEGVLFSWSSTTG